MAITKLNRRGGIILAAASLVMWRGYAWSQNEAASTWTDVAQVAIPMVFVESGDSYQWKPPSEDSGTQRISIQTDHLAFIRRFWRGDASRSQPARAPVLRISIDWDRTSGTYALRHVALGFLGKRIWLAHDISDTDDHYGTLSLQVRWEW
jgi:hypothetical protein